MWEQGRSRRCKGPNRTPPRRPRYWRYSSRRRSSHLRDRSSPSLRIPRTPSRSTPRFSRSRRRTGLLSEKQPRMDFMEVMDKPSDCCFSTNGYCSSANTVESRTTVWQVGHAEELPSCALQTSTTPTRGFQRPSYKHAPCCSHMSSVDEGMVAREIKAQSDLFFAPSRPPRKS